MNESDIKYMSRALSLARRGAGKVSPNPMVGAVIVNKGEIVGEGGHAFFGGPHAEPLALEQAGERARDAVMYVTLEPCSYYGKTPACAPLIVKAGLREVYVGMRDPNPRVSGAGLRLLEESGIRVHAGLMEKECRQLNQPFIKAMRHNLPYLMLKSAQTLDGFVALPDGSSRWITGESARRKVHRWRAEFDAVMTGIGTVLTDNPRLDVRLVKGRPPARIIVDSGHNLNDSLHLVRTASKLPTYYLSPPGSLRRQEAFIRRYGLIPVEWENTAEGWRKALRHLLERGVQSIMVEGGPSLQSQMVEFDLADRLELFYSAKTLGTGRKMMTLPSAGLQSPPFVSFKWQKQGEDMLFSGLLKEY